MVEDGDNRVNDSLMELGKDRDQKQSHTLFVVIAIE
jgi:hypothetical protein